MKLKWVLSTLFLTTATIARSDDGHWADSLNVSAEVSISGATNNKLQPLWSHSQEWGVYTQYKQGEALTHIKADIRLANFKYFTMHAGLGLVGKTEAKRSMLHEAYISGKLYIFDFMAGMQAFSPVAKYDRMTSGNFLMSTNARPTPRLGLGIFNYWSIPMTNNWIQIKGGLYIGRMMTEDYDNRYTNRYTTDVILHEKFAYSRLGGWHLKPYLGLIHSSMMGGTLANGTKLPTDFWKSFVAKGSQQFTGSLRGEATNAAGAHQGLWDAGVDIDVEQVDATIYCKRPFTDATGRHFFDERSRDMYLGTVVSFNKSKNIRSISIEWMKTSTQGGEGTPDPAGYDIHGKYFCLFPGDYPNGPEATSKWMYDHFDKKELDDWAKEFGPFENEGDIQWFLQYKWNHGLFFGGRSNCLNNYYYPQGWTIEEHTMSSAYFHTRKTTDIYGVDGTWQNNTAIPNYRINAITIAIDGSISSKLTWVAKIGITKNHGNLVEKYQGGAYSWERLENYYFTYSKKECYSLFSVSYHLNDQLSLKSTMAGDWGDLYRSLGLRLSAYYNVKWSR